MLSKILQICLALSSITPIFFTLWFIEFSKTWILINGLIYILIAIFLTALSLVIIKISEKKLEKIPVNIKSISPSDKETLSFIFVYLLPLIFSNNIKVNLPILLFIIILFFFSVLTTHMYHFNPVLGLFGYHYYKIIIEGGATYILMTKKTIRNSKEVKQVIQISEYMLLGS